jgi:hypothetical protein
MKPIVRWTFGDPKNEQSYECLKLSILNFIKIYKNDFNYFILYNCCDKDKLFKITKNIKINLIEQNWQDCPVTHKYKPVDSVGNGNHFGGSMWKWCPARLDFRNHEIVIDNDIVFVQYLKKIENFIKSKKVMMTEDPLKFQGRYSHLFDKKEKYNAGFIGMPPGLDMENEIKNIWKKNGSFDNITQADEQGMCTAALKNFESILVTKEEILEIHPKGVPFLLDEEKNYFNLQNFKFKLKNNAYHFVEINRKKHYYWELFLKKEKFFSKITNCL